MYVILCAENTSVGNGAHVRSVYCNIVDRRWIMDGESMKYCTIHGEYPGRSDPYIDNCPKCDILERIAELYCEIEKRRKYISALEAML